MLRCASCRSDLLVLEFEDVEVDCCPSCGGLWLDAGELGLLLDGTPEPDALLALRDGDTSDRRCPICEDRLLTARLAAGVEVDYCRRRHGLWLDRGELGSLLAAESATDRLVRARTFFARLFPQTLAPKETP